MVVIVGPTAVGKTALSVQVADVFATEIISADSRQFYKEMQIGTAKPSKAELSKIPHHFVDFLHVWEPYDAGKHENEALKTLEGIYKDHSVAILAGGSGLYVQAICEGLDEMPETDLLIREKLNEQLKEQGLENLQKQLEAADPAYYAQVDKLNPQRIVRALEVFQSTGIPYSSFRKKIAVAERPFHIIKIGLERDRKELYTRIEQRMDMMISGGLFEEAESLFSYRGHNALHTVGYQEVFGFLEGKYQKDEAIRLLKRNSRRYAKRQMTWFKKDAGMMWFHPDARKEIMEYIQKAMEAA